jgi:anthranilate synthase/aminodeoxychorismate synthase-like glutamine amidotransferase
MILIIDNYDSFTFNLYQSLEELGAHCQVIRNDAITLDGIADLKPQALVISPGPGNPDSAGVSLAAIAHFAGKIPILGVCLGHQAIGQAFGGKVVRAPRLMHGKVSKVKHSSRGLYRGLKNPFSATRYHSLVVDRKTLPKCLEITAQTDDGIIMGLKHRKLAVEGVQFHPESVMTAEGKRLLKNFLEAA